MSGETAFALIGFLVLAGGVLVPPLMRAFDEARSARAELERLPSFKAAELREGPARICGRVIAVDPLLSAPLSSRPCVFHQVGLNLDGIGKTTLIRPKNGCRFEIDDGTGRVLVSVPPPAPAPLPGDERAYEVLCSIRSTVVLRRGFGGYPSALRRFLLKQDIEDESEGYFGKGQEGILAEGDVVAVGGYVTHEVRKAGTSLGYRAPPMGFVIGAMSNHPLILVKR